MEKALYKSQMKNQRLAVFSALCQVLQKNYYFLGLILLQALFIIEVTLLNRMHAAPIQLILTYSAHCVDMHNVTFA